MAHTRVRPPNAPVAAPQAFPSPNSDSEQLYHRPYTVTQHAPTPAHCELWGHIERELSCRTDHALSQNPNESRRRIVFAQTAQLRKDLDDIMHGWQRKTLALWGESLKRHPDDDDDAENPFANEPKAKRPNIFKPQSADAEDDDDDESGKKNGGWQCLYYENDPRSYAQCGEKRYKRVSELRRHIKTHTLPHHCEKCGYRTAEERRLQSHKCEEANRKRYAPVTEEDRHKHEQLARMAVKVGQMKVILFGPDANKEGSDSASGDDGNSYHTTSNSEEEGMMPPSIPTSSYDTNVFPSQPEFMNFTAAPSAGPLLNMPTQSPYTTYGPPSPLPPQILQTLGSMPPQNNGFRGIPIIHSPSTGSAGVYYHENDYTPNTYAAYGPDSPISPTNPQQTSSSSPNSSSYSPPYTHIPFTSSEPMPLPPHRADSNNSLNSYLQNYFPEVTPQYATPVLNRRMPASEIREMERYLASHSLTPLQRRATTYFLQQNAQFERNTLLVRLRKGNQSLSDKGKKFIRTLSTRGRKPPTKRTDSIPLAAQPEAPAAESAAPAENTQLPTPPASPEPSAPADPSSPAAEGEPAPAIRPRPSPQQATSSKAPSAKMSFWKRLTVAKVTPTQEGVEQEGMGTTTTVVAGSADRVSGKWRWRNMLFSSSSKNAAPAAAPVTAAA